MFLSSIYRLCIYIWCFIYEHKQKHTHVSFLLSIFLKWKSACQCHEPTSYHMCILRPNCIFFIFFLLLSISPQHFCQTLKSSRMCLYHPGAPELPSLGIYHGCSTGDWLCCFIALTAASLPCSLLGIFSGELLLIACCRHSFESWGFFWFFRFLFSLFLWTRSPG